MNRFFTHWFQGLLIKRLPILKKGGTGWLVGMALFLGMTSIAKTQEQESVARFVEANQAFEQQNFAKAARLYEALIQEGYKNGHLYYNLGNAYFRLDNLGKAIGNYLQASQYLPRHEDLIANLQYARLQTKDKKENLKQTWREVFQEWSNPLTLQEWLILFVICNGIFWGIGLVQLFYRREIFAWVVFLSGGLALFLAMGAAMRWWAPLPLGTVIPSESAIYSEPHEQATVLFALHAGTEVRIEEERKQWVKIQFEPTRKGWVEKKELFVVLPHE